MLELVALAVRGTAVHRIPLIEVIENPAGRLDEEAILGRKRNKIAMLEKY